MDALEGMPIELAMLLRAKGERVDFGYLRTGNGGTIEIEGIIAGLHVSNNGPLSEGAVAWLEISDRPGSGSITFTIGIFQADFHRLILERQDEMRWQLIKDQRGS